MMTALIKLCGSLCNRLYSIWANYNIYKIKDVCGERFNIQYPFIIAGANNILVEDNVSIGPGATIYTTRAKVIIKQHFLAGPGLTIITGDHMPLLGHFLDTVSDEDKDYYDTKHEYDKDVLIEEDVWCGANVTILKGVTIGRGSILAAGAIVTKDIPRYSIAGGVPAKVIKSRLTEEEIKIHEARLYH